MTICHKDALAWRENRITVEQIAVRENISHHCAQKELLAHDIPQKTAKGRTRWSEDDRQCLREQMLKAEHGGLQLVLEYFQIKSLSNAYRYARIKNRKQLVEEHAQKPLNVTLAEYTLRLTGNKLHKIATPRRGVYLGADAVGELTLDPKGWLKANISMLVGVL